MNKNKVSEARADRSVAGGRSMPLSLRLGALAMSSLVLSGCLQEGWEEPHEKESAGEPAAAHQGSVEGPSSRDSGMLEHDLSSSGWILEMLDLRLSEAVGVQQTSAQAWRALPPEDLRAEASRIASALGLPDIEPSGWDDGSYRSGGEDGEALWVYRSGEWHYSGPLSLQPAWECPESTKVDRYETFEGVAWDTPALECDPPEPPSGVPDVDTSIRATRDILSRINPDDVWRMRAESDPWQVWVQAELDLPGSDAGSGLLAGAGFGGGSALLWAHGTVARAESIGMLELVPLEEAVRLFEAEMNEWTHWHLPEVYPRAGGDQMDDEDPVNAMLTPRGDHHGPEVWEHAETRTHTVTFVSAQLTAIMVHSAQGDLLLLPHYLMREADGGEWHILAAGGHLVGSW